MVFVSSGGVKVTLPTYILLAAGFCGILRVLGMNMALFAFGAWCYALLFFFVLSYLVRIIVSVLIFHVYLVLPAFATYRTSILTRDYRDLDT